MLSSTNDKISLSPTLAESEHYEYGGTDQRTEIPSENEVNRGSILTYGKLMAIVSFVLGYFSDVLVQTMVSTIMQTINQDIGPSSSYVWIASSQTVGTAALSPIIGRLSDIFGRRNFLLLGNILAIIGTVISATTNSINTVIVGGVFIGIASGMRQLAWVALGEIVEKKNRGLAFGFMSQSISLATAFAPVIAYSFVLHYSWRLCYWLSFALDAASFILVFLFYHPINQYIHEEGKTTWDQVLQLDYVGVLLWTAGIVLFLLGISFGGGEFPWASAGTLAPILVGAALILVCAMYEAYFTPKYAAFPPIIFKNIRGFVILQVAVFVLGMLYYSILVLWPQQVAALYATDPLTIGWYASAGGFGGLVLSPLFGLSQRLFQHSRWHLLAATVLMAVFCGCLATSTRETDVSSAALVALCFGMVGAVSLLSLSMAQVGVDHNYIGVATAFMITIRSMGGAVATVVYVTILQNRLQSDLPKFVGIPLTEAGVPPSRIPSIISALVNSHFTNSFLAGLSQNTLQAGKIGLQNAYADSFRLVYLISIAFGVIGIIVVAFAADVDHLMTSQVEIKLLEGARTKIADTKHQEEARMGRVSESATADEKC